MAREEEHRNVLRAAAEELHVAEEARHIGQEEALRRVAGVEEEEPRIAEAAAVRRALEVGDTGQEGAGETGNILPAEGGDTGRTGLVEVVDIVHETEGTGPEEEDIGLVEEGDTGHSPGEAAVLRCVRLWSRYQASKRVRVGRLETAALQIAKRKKKSIGELLTAVGRLATISLIRHIAVVDSAR